MRVRFLAGKSVSIPLCPSVFQRSPERRVQCLCLASQQSLIPAAAGKPRDETRCTGWRVSYYSGSGLGLVADLPAAGDKPQPYDVLFRLEKSPS